MTINSKSFESLLDLSSIKIPNLDKQNTTNISVLKKNIVNHVNQYLSNKSSKEVTEYDWYIQNEEEVLQRLIDNIDKGNNNETLTIIADNSSTLLSNSTSLLVSNSRINPFDLQNISIPKLGISSIKKDEIYELIHQWIKKYMDENYSQYILDVDYSISISNEDIEKLINGYFSNISLEIKNIIIAKSDKVQNGSNLTIANINNGSINTDTSTNNDSSNTDTNNSLDQNNNTTTNKGYFSNVGNVAWVASVLTVGVLVATVVSIFVSRRLISTYGSISNAIHHLKNKKKNKQNKE
ncbi:hypothetical protein D8X55_04545 [Malacoplasma penetrans]|uniref:Uncharacterized protein n=1 Tax=Malacoplasma penetrans (strain HF-2) TaxID=272633 RepID=Q8EVM7_MALP2|nr:hypothetical protein [Malacoplasma penetrans]RXY96160.1 hypothetical protein D8X55_04545 [Malacoplasma penetrans]BAC44325.1 hypothetical protein [Malacoplasma penetrans HF-2]